jgi:hypothetical protein
MAHTNRYYTIQSDDTNMNEINSVIVGRPETQRYSIDNSQIVVKLHQNDHSQYSFLSQYEEQLHPEILITMSSPEWTHEIP